MFERKLKNDLKELIMSKKREVPFWGEPLDRHELLEIGEIYVENNLYKSDPKEREILFNAAMLLSKTYWVKHGLYGEDFNQDRSMGFLDLAEAINRFEYINSKSNITKENPNPTGTDEEIQKIVNAERDYYLKTGIEQQFSIESDSIEKLRAVRTNKQRRDYRIEELAKKIGYHPSENINIPKKPSWNNVNEFYKTFINPKN